MIGKSFEAKFKWPRKKDKIVNLLKDKQARLDPRAKSRTLNHNKEQAKFFGNPYNDHLVGDPQNVMCGEGA